MNKNYILTILTTFLALVGTKSLAATMLENFENPSTVLTSNIGGTVTYSSGNWSSYGINKMTSVDRFNDVSSIRMRGLAGKSTLTMMFDHAGAGVVSFNYGSYSNHSGGAFTLQQSTDGGTTWTNVGSAVTVPVWSGTFLTYSATVNYNGNIRFRIAMTETASKY